METHSNASERIAKATAAATQYRLTGWSDLRDDGELLIDLIDANGHEHGLSLSVEFYENGPFLTVEKLELFTVVGVPYEGQPTEAQAHAWLKANRAAAESAALDAHEKRAARWRAL